MTELTIEDELEIIGTGAQSGGFVSGGVINARENDEMADIGNDCVIINSKDVEKTIAELTKELEILTKLGKSFLDICPDDFYFWAKGVTLIRDSFFLDHTRSIAAKQIITADQLTTSSQNGMDSWPLKFIDWELAAENLKERYISIDYDGVKYWVKKPI